MICYGIVAVHLTSHLTPYRSFCHDFGEDLPNQSLDCCKKSKHIQRKVNATNLKPALGAFLHHPATKRIGPILQFLGLHGTPLQWTYSNNTTLSATADKYCTMRTWKSKYSNRNIIHGNITKFLRSQNTHKTHLTFFMSQHKTAQKFLLNHIHLQSNLIMCIDCQCSSELFS